MTGLVTSVALTVFIPNELRGLCIVAFIAIAGMIGFGIAPTLVSVVSQMLVGAGSIDGVPPRRCASPPMPWPSRSGTRRKALDRSPWWRIASRSSVCSAGPPPLMTAGDTI